MSSRGWYTRLLLWYPRLYYHRCQQQFPQRNSATFPLSADSSKDLCTPPSVKGAIKVWLLTQGFDRHIVESPLQHGWTSALMTEPSISLLIQPSVSTLPQLNQLITYRWLIIHAAHGFLIFLTNISEVNGKSHSNAKWGNIFDLAALTYELNLWIDLDIFLPNLHANF